MPKRARLSRSRFVLFRSSAASAARTCTPTAGAALLDREGDITYLVGRPGGREIGEVDFPWRSRSGHVVRGDPCGDPIVRREDVWKLNLCFPQPDEHFTVRRFPPDGRIAARVTRG